MRKTCVARGLCQNVLKRELLYIPSHQVAELADSYTFLAVPCRLPLLESLLGSRATVTVSFPSPQTPVSSDGSSVVPCLSCADTKAEPCMGDVATTNRSQGSISTRPLLFINRRSRDLRRVSLAALCSHEPPEQG